MFLSQADCCAAVAAAARGVNSGRIGRASIVMTAGRSSTGSAVVVFPGRSAQAASDNKNPKSPCRLYTLQDCPYASTSELRHPRKFCLALLCKLIVAEISIVACKDLITTVDRVLQIRRVKRMVLFDDCCG